MYLLTQQPFQRRIEQQWIQQIRTEGTEWVQRQRFWLFGTAVYRFGIHVTEEELERDARHLFNVLDKNVLTRKQIKDGTRLPRLVFKESGYQRDNLHFHFFIKGLQWQHYRAIEHTTPHIWCERINKAHQLSVKDNLSPHHSRSGYGWKEYRSLSDLTLLTECCHV